MLYRFCKVWFVGFYCNKTKNPANETEVRGVWSAISTFFGSVRYAGLLTACVMKPQVGCTTVGLVHDDKSIYYIQEHHDDWGVIQTTSITNTTKPRDAWYLWQSFISTIVYRLLLNNLEAAGRIPPQQINIYIITSQRFVYSELAPRS